MKVTVIIPALNEAGCIGPLVANVRLQPVDQVIVVDNGSDDGTASEAERAGALVVRQDRRGYGYACSAGAAAATGADALVFIDGDYSFLPEDMPALLAPLGAGEADLVLGSRTPGRMLPGALPPHQRFGNGLAALVLKAFYGLQVTDLGPYRAIKSDLLQALDMREMTYGWPIEMMIKSARLQARIVEVPVRYQPRRAGRSKVGGTLHGSLFAACHILKSTIRYARWRD